MPTAEGHTTKKKSDERIGERGWFQLLQNGSFPARMGMAGSGGARRLGREGDVGWEQKKVALDEGKISVRKASLPPYRRA